MNRLVIIGASGHGSVLTDIALSLGYTDIVFMDDDPDKKTCAGFPVMGGGFDLSSRRVSPETPVDYVVGIGNPKTRQMFRTNIDAIEEGLEIKDHEVTLIHPGAVLGRNVTIGRGTVVMAGAVINHGASIGESCIINTCSSVDHDCVLGDQVHVAVGAHVAGMVNVGTGTWIGAGATISNNVDICDSCMIGAGCVVIKNITEPGTYVGVPAVQIK